MAIGLHSFMAFLAIFPLFCLLRAAITSSSSLEELSKQELFDFVESAVVVDLLQLILILEITRHVLHCHGSRAGGPACLDDIIS